MMTRNRLVKNHSEIPKMKSTQIIKPFRLKKPVKELQKAKMVNPRRLEADQRDLASSVSVLQRRQPRPLQK